MPNGYSFAIHISMLLLSAIGTLMVISASMKTGVSSSRLLFQLIRQVIFFLLSYSVMVFGANYFSWKYFKNKQLLTLIGLITIVLLILPRFMGATYGQYNWIRLGRFSIQPAELAKPIIICMMAYALGTIPKSRDMLNLKKLRRISFFQKMKFILQKCGLTFFLVFIMFLSVAIVEKDFGTGMIIVLICIGIFFMTEHPYLRGIQRVLSILFFVGVGLVIFMMTPYGESLLYQIGLKEYQVLRITALRHMFDPQFRFGSSFQQVIGLYAFARGGLFGKGLGASVQKYGYLPAADTDYILAIVIEEFGFLGFLVITFLFGTIIYMCFKYIFKFRQQHHKLVLVGVVMFIFIHYLLNVGGTSGVVPLTGIPLLLISSGGSAQLALYISIGVVQNLISRHNYEIKKGSKVTS